MGFALTPDGIHAEQHRQADLRKALPGHQAESPGSHPPPHRTGSIAAGHPVSLEPPGGDPFDPGHVDTHMWLQPPMQPRDFPEIRPITPEGAFATLGSSITEQNDMHMVRLQQFDAAGAAQAKPLPGNPSGDPNAAGHAGQQMHTAPSGFGQQFRQNPGRAHGSAYLPAPGEGTS